MKAVGRLAELTARAVGREGRRDSVATESSAPPQLPRWSVRLIIALAILALAVAAGVSFTPARARGDEAVTEEQLGPTAAQTKALLESGKAPDLVEEPETDLHAAQTMPHRELERGEALELTEAVFAPELEAAAGIYGQIEPERFVSNFASVVPVSSLPEAPDQSNGGLATEHPNMPVLLESTLPLRTESSSGEEEAVDLALEHSEGELQPHNPITEVGIPNQLGEGIHLPGPGIEVKVSGAPEDRAPTNASGEFAFYPEIAENSDLIVAPTPQGVETMVDIRSAEAPRTTTYELGLPEGATLESRSDGGAEVVENGATTLLIPPPQAIDAAGHTVPSEMRADDGKLVVQVNPESATTYPILVDPTYITESWNWTWNHDILAAWKPSTTGSPSYCPLPYTKWDPNHYPGLDLSTWCNESARVVSESHADWTYQVPRYAADLADPRFHTPPSTWVYQLLTSGVLYLGHGYTNYPGSNYPALVIGITNIDYGWNVDGVHYKQQGEMTDWSNGFTFTNELLQTHDKGAAMNLVTYEDQFPEVVNDSFIGAASVAVVDEDAPTIVQATAPEKWVGGSWASVSYAFGDAGLGVELGRIGLPGEAPLRWSEGFNCNGTTAAPCPRQVKSTEAGRPALAFVPSELPTGKDLLEVEALDAFGVIGVAGHAARTYVLVEVDHTAPEASLSGPLTEQGSFGTRRSSYALRVNAKDGAEGAPQSGIKKVEVLVDGKKVVMPEESEWEPNCQTQNCPFSGEWAMNASEYGPGPHEVQVIATDAAGNASTPKTLHVELHPPAPTLSLSGTMTEQATLGSERPSYNLHIAASALAESPTPASLPSYSSSFGAPGSGNGQFTRPGGMAIEAQGNIVVVDSNDNRVEGFSEKGEYLGQFGTKGSGDGQFSRPTAVAVEANGDLVVTDSGNRRVEGFSPSGTYLGKYGSEGTGPGQFAGFGPEAIAVDAHGNVWVADTYGGRIEKFEESGKFVRSVGTRGKGPGQLLQPDGIAIAPGGNIFVSDWEGDKVVEYGEGGAFIREFGSQGNEPGQLENPTGIAIDSRGDVWVADQNNGRIEEFSQGGQYLGRFGAKGTGAGQFELSYPTGIATDTKGDIWVSDTGDNRVEKWVSANYGSTLTPTYLRSIGSPGTTAGHFSDVLGLAVDAKGNIWTADAANNLLQKFGPKGEFLAAYGKAGAGNGELSAPTALTANSGHIWDGEMANARVQEFNESGGYLSKFGQSGNTPGQLEYPWGIAIDGSHHVWVAELGANAVQEFTESGTLVRTLGKKGSGNGEFNGATGIVVGPGGKLWVVDFGNNRVEEFTESGTFLRQFGGKESEVGHLGEPLGIYVDKYEHVWVVDRVHHRVVEFNGSGEYLGQFGSAGTGPGQFGVPEYVVGDQSGHLFVSDSGNDNVQEWSDPAPHSQVSSEIRIDGKRVEAIEKSCEAETCNSTTEWTLQASSLTPGSHEVEVRATDGLGNTTAKSMSIKVGDTTKPTLEVGGELATAPEGWIAQEEGNYGLHATATDAGYGVTSVVFSLAGKTVTSKLQKCPAGACSATVSASVNARELSAGAHQAEVVATDGAGNVATRAWTVNVDPEGHISSEEATRTLEASDQTSSMNAVGVSQGEEGVEGSSPGLEVEETPSGFTAVGSEVPLTIATSAEGGMTMEVAGPLSLATVCESEVPGGEAESATCLPRARAEELAQRQSEEVAEGKKQPGMEPITIAPKSVASDAETAQEVSGNAVVAGSTALEADTVTRPLTDGGLTFAEIRGPDAPEHYAFEMTFGPEEQLLQVNSQTIELIYTEIGVPNLTISAIPASDAIGTQVPTHLSVTGSHEITLTVEHRAPSPAGGAFVYPVISGAGWQGGYRTLSVYLGEPPPEPPPVTGEESPAGEEFVISAPEPSTPQKAGITDPSMIAQSRTSTVRHEIRNIRCVPKDVYDAGPEGNGYYGIGEFRCGNPFSRTVGSSDSEFSFGVKGWFYDSPGHFVSHAGHASDEIECPKMNYPEHYIGGVLTEPDWFIDPAQKCEWWGKTGAGNGGQWEPVGKHIIAYGEWNYGRGHPGNWTISQLGELFFITATGGGYSVERFKTTCIPCHE